MKECLMCGLLLFPTIKPTTAVDPIFPVPPSSNLKLIEDSLPPVVFYFVGGGVFFAGAMAYMRLKY